VDTGCARSLDELVDEATLSHASIGNDTDDLALTFARASECGPERSEIVRTAHEGREAPASSPIEGSAGSAEPQQPERPNPVSALDGELAEILELEVSLDQTRSGRRDIGLADFRELLHPLRQTDGVSLRRIVHAQVVADLSDHDLTRVDADPCSEGEPVLTPHRFGPNSAMIPSPVY
jgi:hypothetical protein